MTHELLLDGRLRDRGIFDDREVTRLWHEHRSRQADHRHRLWQLVMLELWFRQFIDRPGGPVSRPASPAGGPRRQGRRGPGRGTDVRLKGSLEHMCGIAGIVAADHLDGRGSRARAADARRHRPSRPGRRRPVRRRPGGPRPSPPEHRRSRRRAAAAGERRRHDLDRLQRRDLQPRRRPAASSKRPGHATARGPTPRRSSTPTSSGATTASSASAACSRSRSGTRRGGGCCSPAIASASSRSTGRCAGDRLLFGSEIKAILESGLIARRGQRGGAARAARHPLPLRRRDAVQGHPPAAARAHARLRERHGHDPAVLGRARRPRRPRARARCPSRTPCSSSASCSRSRSASG